MSYPARAEGLVNSTSKVSPPPPNYLKSDSLFLILKLEKNVYPIDFTKRVTKFAKYVPEKLQTCVKVWIRVDRVRRQLEAPIQVPTQSFGERLNIFQLR